MIPRSVDDLKHRNRGLARIAEATVGLMGRTPDYMSVKFASFASRSHDWLGADGGNEEGARNIVRFQKRIAREVYERFYLTSATRNRINNHLRNVDRSRAYALVDGILAAGRDKVSV
jgi:aromatic ring hydroxylase